MAETASPPPASAPPPAPAEPKRKWAWLRFSLRTLLLLVLLLGSAATLWTRWAPWYCQFTLDGPAGRTRCLFSPDEATILNTHVDAGAGFFNMTLDSANVWDAQSGKRLSTICWSHSAFFSFSKNGRLIHVEKEQYTRVFEAKTGRDIFSKDDRIRRIVWSGDGRYFLVFFEDRDPEFWSAETGARVFAFGVSSDLKISYPEEGFLSNDGRWAAFTVEKQAEDKTWHHFQQCWNCETGLLVRELPVEETIAGICPDGTMLVLEKARPNKTILRNPEDWKEIRVLDGTARDSPVLSPDGRYCITDDGKNTLLHSLTDQTVIRRLEGNKSYSQFSPDGKLLLTGWYFPKNPTLKWYDRMHNYDLRIWNAESGILVGSARLDDVLLWQPPVWISSRHVYAPIDPRHQWIWDTTASPPPFSDHYFQIRYSPDGNRFAQFDDRAIFKMGDTSIATPSVIVRTPAKVLNIVLSKIGDRVLTSHTDDKVRLWRQRRPEPWWGIAWLPESWLTLLFGGVLIWSLFRDRRENRRSA